jgi:hypothetical protein
MIVEDAGDSTCIETIYDAFIAKARKILSTIGIRSTNLRNKTVDRLVGDNISVKSRAVYLRVAIPYKETTNRTTAHVKMFTSVYLSGRVLDFMEALCRYYFVEF